MALTRQLLHMHARPCVQFDPGYARYAAGSRIFWLWRPYIRHMGLPPAVLLSWPSGLLQAAL
jgi:hypothetical protein